MVKSKDNKEKILVAISILFLVSSWVYVVIKYPNLPENIVAHMDLEGNINRFDNKEIIWFLLILFTAILVFFYWLSQKKPITQNSKNQKIGVLLALPYLSIVLFGLCYMMINKTLDQNYNTDLFMYVFAGLTLFLVLISIILSYKTSQK